MVQYRYRDIGNEDDAFGRLICLIWYEDKLRTPGQLHLAGQCVVPRSFVPQHLARHKLSDPHHWEGNEGKEPRHRMIERSLRNFLLQSCLCLNLWILASRTSRLSRTTSQAYFHVKLPKWIDSHDHTMSWASSMRPDLLTFPFCTVRLLTLNS